MVSGGFGFVDAIKRLGVERRVYTSGKSKVQLDPFLPQKEAGGTPDTGSDRSFKFTPRSKQLVCRDANLTFLDAFLTQPRSVPLIA